MALFSYLHVAITTRLAELRENADQGDSPVPTAIIIAGLAALASTIMLVIVQRANGWIARIPTP